MQQRPSDGAYQQMSAMRLTGALQPEALQAALQLVAERHASLRMRFPAAGGIPAARIELAVSLTLKQWDLSGLAPARQDGVIQQLGRDAARAAMDLERGPLLHGSLLRLGPEDWVLLLVAHHMTIDGWSLGLLIEDLAQAYRLCIGGSPGHARLPAVEWDIADYVAEALATTRLPSYEASTRYWQEHLAGTCWSRLAPDRGARPTGAGRTLRRRFDGVLAPLDALCRSLCVTRYQVLVAAFLAWTGMRTGQPDVAIATLLANRPERRHQRVVGFLANTVVLRHACDTSRQAGDFVLDVAGTTRDLLRHGGVSLYTLAERCAGVFARPPSILFALQNLPPAKLALGDIGLSMLDIDAGIAKFELSLYLAESAGGLELWVEYDTELYSEGAVVDFVDGYGRAVDAFCGGAQRNAPVADLLRGIAPPSMRAGPPVTGTGSPTLAQAMLQRCSQSPTTPALRCADRTYSFAQVASSIAAVRNAFRRLGVRMGDRVAVVGDRGLATLAAMWACMIEGACYVPLSPDLPVARLQAMLEQADAHWHLRERPPPKEAVPARGGQWHDIGAWLAQARADALPVPPDPPPALAAYLIFTSGSTGMPKGVVVTQGNLSRFAQAMDSVLPAVEGGEWLAVSSLSFDIAVLELFWAMSRGMQVTISSLADLDAARPLPDTAGGAPALSLFYGGSSGQYGADTYAALLAQTSRWADDHGLHALWTAERHFGGLACSPVVTSTALASRSGRIGVRAGSLIGPLHSVIRVAEDWSLLHRLSGGRAGLSLAAGSNPADFVLASQPIGRRRDVMAGQVTQLRALWRGEGVAFADPDGRFFDVHLDPPPDGDIPLWMAVSNRPEQFVLAAELGVGVVTHLLEQDTEQLARHIELYRMAWERHWGNERPPGQVTLVIHTLVGADDGQAEAAALPHLRQQLASSAGDGLVSPGTEAAHPPSGSAQTGTPAQEALRLIRDRSLVAGPEGVARRMTRLFRLGVDELACLVDFGPSAEAIMEGLHRLVLAKAACESRPDAAPAGPTHLQCTPSAARLLLREGGHPVLAGLRCWAVGGEALDGTLVQQMRSATDAPIHNLYGPTEATVWASAARIPARRTGPLSIGVPLRGVRFHVLDERLDPVPEGVEGQLFIAGAGVAQGYWRQPAGTAAAFLPDLTVAGERMYATGDRVRMARGGALEFLGRNDLQVKIGGQRIELEGMRAVLAAHHEVAEAVVLPVPLGEDGGDTTIAAFVVPRPGASDGLVSRLRDHLGRHWEAGTLPQDVLPVASIPLTANQKTDVAALALLLRRHIASGTGRGDGDGLAGDDEGIGGTLREIWRGHLSRMEDHCDFHRLGGNSLIALQLLARANRDFGVALTLQDFYRNPTLGGHLAAIRAARAGGAACELVRVARDRFEYPVSAGQRAMLILEALGHAPGDSYHGHVVQHLDGALEPAAARRAFEALVARHRIFRTAYRFGDDGFTQVWRPDLAPSWHEVDAAPETSDEDLLRAFIDRPFDPERGDVMRALLARRGTRWTLCIVAHHVVCDGASFRLVLGELLADYRRAAAGLPLDRAEAPWQYVDYVDWQQRHLSRHGDRLASFWRRQLLPLQAADAAGRLAPGPAGVARIDVRAPLTRAIEALAQRLRLGQLAVLLLPLALLEEARRGDGPVVPVATDARNRPLPEFEQVPGMTVNQLLLALRLPDGGSIEDALRSCNEQLTAAFSHQEYPFEAVVSQARRAGQGHVPLFDLKVVLNEAQVEPAQVDGLRISEARLQPRVAKFGLLVNLQRDGECLSGEVVFDASRRDQQEVLRWCRAYPLLLERIAAGDDLRSLRSRVGDLQDELRGQQSLRQREAALGRIRLASRKPVTDDSDV